MKLLHKGLVLISVPLAFELVFALGFGSLLKKSLEQLNSEMHAKQVISKADRIHALLTESSLLIGLNFTTRDNETEARFNSNWKKIKENYKSIKNLARDETEARLIEGAGRQIKQVGAIQKLAMSGAFTPKEPGPVGPAPEISMHAVNWFKHRVQERSGSPVQRLIDYELGLVSSKRDLQKEFSSQLGNFLIFGICGDIALIGSLALVFGSSVERRLKNLMNTTTRLSKGEDLPPPLQGDDELAQSDILLHDTAARLIEIQRFKKQLLGIVCHELKAPLSAVQILLSLAASDTEKISRKALDAVARSERSCTRLQIMVMELLDMEVMTSGKVNLNRQTVDCAQLLETAAEQVRSLAKGSDIELILEVHAQEISLDADRVTQVLVNLLSNAIKFSPRGGKIILNCTETESSVKLSVKDEGPGIPPELHKSIFEAFSQGKQQPESQKIKGTGLGLAISKTIAEAHGGTIQVQSTPGEGATFEVDIPKEAPDGCATKNERKDALVSQQEQQKVGKRKLRFRIRQKGLVLIGLPLLTQLAFIGTLALLLQQASVQVEQQASARKVATAAMQVLNTAADSAILSLLGRANENSANLYQEHKKTIDSALSELNAACLFDKQSLDSSVTITKLLSSISERQEHLLQDTTQPPVISTPEERKLYQNTWTDFSKNMDQLASRAENQESISSKALDVVVANVDRVLIIGLLLNVLSAVGLTMFLTQNITKRIHKVQLNARRLLTKESLLPPVSGSDEIADLDKAFHEAAATLREEQQLKKQLVAIASHELRSPLTSVYTTLNMLSAGMMGTLPDKTAERISKAEAATERLIALINDILDIEKMEAGMFVLSVAPVSLRDVVAGSIECILPIASNKSVCVENLVHDEKVLADEEKLNQALVNLLSNAVKFSMENQTVKVTSSFDTQSNTVVVSITDQGKGIPAELQSSMFERFQSNNDDAQNSTGTGLGLPISKAIIEQHGGKVGFESEEGKGATFWFTLPCADQLYSRNDIQAL